MSTLDNPPSGHERNDGQKTTILQNGAIQNSLSNDQDPTSRIAAGTLGLHRNDHDRQDGDVSNHFSNNQAGLGSLKSFRAEGLNGHHEHLIASQEPWQKGIGSFETSVFDTQADEITTAANGAVPPSQSHGHSENHGRRKQSVSKLSPQQLKELTHSPESLPVRALPPVSKIPYLDTSNSLNVPADIVELQGPLPNGNTRVPLSPVSNPPNSPLLGNSESSRTRNLTIDTGANPNVRPIQPQRALSTPASIRGLPSPRKGERSRPGAINVDEANDGEKSKLKAPCSSRPLPSPMPKSIPVPPMSVATYLQLELSSQRPSQLYIHRSANADFPYESSRAKIERLLNFLYLPFHLEGVLWFGMLACIDSWLYTFTILPLRLLKSFYILGQSWATNLMTEAQFVTQFIYSGTGRMWRRRRTRSQIERKVSEVKVVPVDVIDGPPLKKPRALRHHRRSKSVPSMLLPDDKADILKGLLIICTTLVLLQFDASRMYHWVRGQAAIKLYVIYNILEVCDRLFSAIGQDVLECLFSREALERREDGRSKVLRPTSLFMLALVYTVIHSTALFYQVITLNVAVNSYSNALITLLMSNQFVEIKSTVFKKFEKENLFQLTCADVVERFQLWHMLLIIASRNIVETGGFWTKGFSALSPASTTLAAAQATNSSIPITPAVPPLTVSSILPKSFTVVPSLIDSITSYVPTVNHVLGPFLIVMGSEMLVDWLKHAYINKFNNTRPAIYDRFLDVLCKDYYTNAFGDQNLTKRLGLPVIPLSCLLIRAGVQIYQMFMAVWVPSASPSSATTLATIHEQYSSNLGPKPTTASATITRKIDELLGGFPSAILDSHFPSTFTFMVVLMLFFLVLLACKLVLGMLLLAFARARYRSMKEREKNPIHHVEGGRRVGGWGVVEVDEDKRRWIYEDDPDGLQALQDRETRDRMKREKERDAGVGTDAFERVKRYEMVAKRIW